MIVPSRAFYEVHRFECVVQDVIEGRFSDLLCACKSADYRVGELRSDPTTRYAEGFVRDSSTGKIYGLKEVQQLARQFKTESLGSGR